MFGINSCGGGGNSTPASTTRQWTYMVYLGADNNLSPAGLADINEMETVGSDSNMAIVVQAEFSATYTPGVPTTTRRYYVQNDGNPSQPSLNNPVQDLGSVNMADPASLTAFITWVKTNYPAQHYALVIWDHGDGWKASRFNTGLFRGAVSDETSGSFMSLPDLAKGVSDSGLHFDVINFDACLMAMYEVAYQFRDLTDFMVFSEETEPGEGDPYDTVLAALKANPSMTARTLASTIVDKYDQFFAANNRGKTTKSAVDMAQLPNLDAKLLSLVTTLNADGSSLAVVQAARSNTQEYASPTNHDLWHFSDYLTASAAGAAVKSAAADVKTAITAMVVNNLTNGAGVANSHGLAIYLPQDSETNATELADYALLACNQTRAAAAGSWGAYIDSLLSGSSGGTATYAPGNFGLYLAWTDTNDQTCDSDLDLYVWEPAADFGTTGNGDIYAPWMGQTSPNGFFSLDSYDSGVSAEYYLANTQVLTGDYYFLVNYWDNGISCTQAKAHLYLYSPADFGDSNWHEVTSAELGVSLAYPSPVLLDLSSPWTGQTLTALADLNNYSDWWVPLALTRSGGGSPLLGSSSMSPMAKGTQLILRIKKGARLIGGVK